MARSIISSSEEDTSQLAGQAASQLKGGEVLCLSGELGSGKTTFVGFLAAELGVKERLVSPTFVLLRTYETEHPMIKQMHHIDAYRLESRNDYEGLGLSDLFTKDSVVVIEWAEKIKEWLPQETTIMDISFAYTANEGEREITISP